MNSTSTALRIVTTALSHVGLQRTSNEDAHAVLTGGRLLAVADGMGGHAAGEVASALAIEAVRAAEEVLGSATAGVPALLAQIFADARRRCLAFVDAHPQAERMGTTLTVAHVSPSGALTIGHLGDSRVYLRREGVLRCLTTDHSYVMELVEAGRLTREQARVHPWSARITKAVLGSRDADAHEPDLEETFVLPGDQLLVCSDGLTDMVPEEMLSHLLACPDPAEMCLEAALEAGGRDNITLVLAEVRAAEGVARGRGGPNRAAARDG